MAQAQIQYRQHFPVAARQASRTHSSGTPTIQHSRDQTYADHYARISHGTSRIATNQQLSQR